MVRRVNGRPSWLVMLAVLAALAVAAPAAAQGAVKGTVKDSKGQPVEGAKVTIEMTGGSRTVHFENKTDKKGEFMQVGLPLGSYRIVAEKDALGSAPATTNVRSGVGVPINLVLDTAAAAEVAKSGQLKKLFDEAVALADAGNHAGAIDKFNEAIKITPKCNDCYDNIGSMHFQDKEYDKAEAAYKKAIEINPNDSDGYNGLATVYNAQRKFDEAAAASKKAAELSGGIGAAGGGGNADSLYNQGVALFNGGKAADAKPLFEQAIQSKPDHADAHYMLGMTLAGENPAKAVAEFEEYLKLAPTGKNADQAKQFISLLPH